MATISHLAFYMVLLFGMYALAFQFSNFRPSKGLEYLLNALFISALAITAYSMWLGPGADLARYYIMLDDMRVMTLPEALIYGHYKNTIIANVFMWSISQTGNNQLLPFLSTLIITGNIFYLISLEQNRTQMSHATKLNYLVLLFAVVTLATITTCVRHAWMMSVFAIAAYRDLVLHKRNFVTILLYAAAPCIHTSGLMLILVRLYSLLKGKWKLIIIFWIFLIPYLQQFVGLDNIFGEASKKLFAYQQYGTEGLDIRWRLARMGFLCIMTFICYRMRKTTNNRLYHNFYASLLLFTWGSISVAQVMYRLTDCAAFMSLPLLNDFVQTQAKQEIFIIKAWLTFICLGLFAYHGVFLKTSINFI